MNNDELFQRAKQILPGGVDSPVRAYGAVGGTPRFLVSASGAYVRDAAGRDYVDLIGSWGPALVGHAHEEVIGAVARAAAKGLSFGAPTPGEVELGEALRGRVPGAEMVRFVSTGTEATMTAIRLARGATGRDLVVKFAGCYHGHHDALLAEAGSGVATTGIPGTAGVTAATTSDTVVLPYNDFAALTRLFTERGGEIAAVITEAAAANMGVVAPLSGFNAHIRELTSAAGALMILDEVLTGFRVSPAGWWGLEGVTPDLFTFGKVIGGGLPAAALGGRRELMELLAPLGPVYQAGTLSGNPLSMAAGLATLKAADAALYRHIDQVAATLGSEVSAALSQAGVPHQLQRAGNLFSVMFTPTPVTNYAEAAAQETWRYPAFFHAMREAGILLPPSVFEAWFVSGAHGPQEIEKIVAALPAAARAAANANM